LSVIGRVCASGCCSRAGRPPAAGADVAGQGLVFFAEGVVENGACCSSAQGDLLHRELGSRRCSARSADAVFQRSRCVRPFPVPTARSGKGHQLGDHLTARAPRRPQCAAVLEGGCAWVVSATRAMPLAPPTGVPSRVQAQAALDHLRFRQQTIRCSTRSGLATA